MKLEWQAYAAGLRSADPNEGVWCYTCGRPIWFANARRNAYCECCEAEPLQEEKPKKPGEDFAQLYADALRCPEP